MRSYYEHLKTLIKPGEKLNAPKPIFRASSIFPAIQKNGIKTRVLFMGYWTLKRHIDHLTCVVTVRSKIGETLSRQTLLIENPNAYRIELDQLIDPNQEFEGSIECEFYSSVPMVFPFPATSINYYGPTFSTIVHTAQRVYNDFEDREKNSVTSVPESGFNVYVDEKREPFISVINGPAEVKNPKIHLTFFNHKKEVMKHEVKKEVLKPYEALFLYLSRECALEEFLDGEKGAVKAEFQVDWVYPRLVVGNIAKDLNALSITHTYYDCTEASDTSDYWYPKQKGWYPASLILPVKIDQGQFTRITFYPIYSPSTFSIDVEVYSPQGTLLGRKEKVLTITSPSDRYSTIDFGELCHELKIDPNQELGGRLIATTDEDTIPARIKIGYDIGYKEKGLPFNICTNLQPFNPSLENKPSTFRWSPLLADQSNSEIWIMNSSQHENYTQDAEVHLTFYRESDRETVERTLILPPHGFEKIAYENDPELQEFLQGTIGWMTAVSTNPYIITYYSTTNPSGIVGGDHGF